MTTVSKKYPSDLTGILFGHLTAMYIDPKKTSNNKVYWRCQCDCGKEKSVCRQSLTNGTTQSCGHVGLKRLIEQQRKASGKNKDKLYAIWSNIQKKCYNEKSKDFKNYGAIGVKVDERWLKYETFRDDLKATYDKHVEQYGDKSISLDIIDVKKNYNVDNCCWVIKPKKSSNKIKKVLDRMKVGFNLYQYLSTQTAQYPFAGENPYYVVLGLGGEAGEVCDKFKKIMRDKNGIINDHDKNEISKELGDCLWYLSQICEELGINLEDVAIQNIKKLADRKERGVIMGEGDNR